MAVEFRLKLAGPQVSIFNADLEDPFNDWSEAHMQQGFTWRPGSVSFWLPRESGRVNVACDMVGAFNVQSASQIAIVVPMICFGSVLEISSILDQGQLEVEPGHYAMLFEYGTAGNVSTIHLSLRNAPAGSVKPQILRGTSIDLPLIMEALPARYNDSAA